MDGFSSADNSIIQNSATEAFLRGCRHKEAAALALNQCPNTIQDACKAVRTLIANKKAIFGSKVSFKERHFTSQEEERVSNIEKRLYTLDRDLRRSSMSPYRRDTPYPSPQRYPNPYPSPQRYQSHDSWTSRSPSRERSEGTEFRGRPRMRDSRDFKNQNRNGTKYQRYSPSGERQSYRYQSPSYGQSPSRSCSPFLDQYNNNQRPTFHKTNYGSSRDYGDRNDTPHYGKSASYSNISHDRGYPSKSRHTQGHDNQASKRPDGSDKENLTNKRDRQYSRSPGVDPGRWRSNSFDRNADLNLKGLDIPAAKV